VCAEIARQEGIEAEGYRVVLNTNRAAGQSVYHLHFHLLGGRLDGLAAWLSAPVVPNLP
jgi:histidine triad (HIT) family protein